MFPFQVCKISLKQPQIYFRGGRLWHMAHGPQPSGPRPGSYLPYYTPLRNRLGTALGRFHRPKRRISISQNWLEGYNMATMKVVNDWRGHGTDNDSESTCFRSWNARLRIAWDGNKENWCVGRRSCQGLPNKKHGQTCGLTQSNLCLLNPKDHVVLNPTCVVVFASNMLLGVHRTDVTSHCVLCNSNMLPKHVWELVNHNVGRVNQSGAFGKAKAVN